jgi:alkaline phosphatase D
MPPMQTARLRVPRFTEGVMSVLVLLLASACASPERPEPAAEAAVEVPLQRIAFGSCADQTQPQPIWDAVLATRPDLFVFAGDNVYADTHDMDTLRARYALLAAQPGFQRLRASVPLLATWDDHDYGENDAGAWYAEKDSSRAVFFDFFGVPADAPRRQHAGIYDAQVFGPPGRRVQVILLDTRYFRGPFGRNDLGEAAYQQGFGPYGPNPDTSATMLGAAQWAWLAEQLAVPAEVRLVVSSIQVVSAEHGWEVWAQLPHEQARLYRLIEETGAAGVVFLSGDVHWGELSRHDGGPYPLYDLTSSAINQEYVEALHLPNARRVGPSAHPYPNFGLVEIDWAAPDPLIRLQVRDVQGRPVIAHEVRLSALGGPAG